MTTQEFRHEAMLLAQDENRGDRLLQLILGEAESRGACLAHEIMEVAQNVDNGETSSELNSTLDELETESRGA